MPLLLLPPPPLLLPMLLPPPLLLLLLPFFCACCLAVLHGPHHEHAPRVAAFAQLVSQDVAPCLPHAVPQTAGAADSSSWWSGVATILTGLSFSTRVSYLTVQS